MTPINESKATAVISDVHGNRWALEAVLDDINNRGISRIVNLGDSLYGPLDPRGTADILMSRDIVSVRGNEDRIITDGSETSPTLKFVREQMTPSVLDWLKELSAIVTNPDEALFHGTPECDTEYLLRQVTENGLEVRSTPQLESMLTEIKQSVVLCGHDHMPGQAGLSDGRLVVNPGSVGLQAYTDDIPHDHVVENGSPHARYAILDGLGADCQVEFVTVEYDWAYVSRVAQKNGRPDWSDWLLTGRAGA